MKITPHKKFESGVLIAAGLWFITQLSENAFFGWIDEKLGLTNAFIERFIALSWHYGFPLILIMAGVWALSEPVFSRKSSKSLPDWTIRELFFHLHPDVTNHVTKMWQHVGQEVRDKFSTGELQCWGRSIDSSRSRSALRAIEKEYWADAEFTYWFFDENNQEMDHVRNKKMGITYADLQVNKSQILETNWSDLSRFESISLTDACRWLYETARENDSIWAYAAERLGAKGETQLSSSNEILNYMATYIAGKIAIFGVRPPSRTLEKFSLDKENGSFENNATEFITKYGRSQIFSELRVKLVDLDAVIQEIKDSHKAGDPI